MSKPIQRRLSISRSASRPLWEQVVTSRDPRLIARHLPAAKSIRERGPLRTMDLRLRSRRFVRYVTKYGNDFVNGLLIPILIMRDR